MELGFSDRVLGVSGVLADLVQDAGMAVDMVKIVEASYAIWRKDKLNGARAAFKVPEVRQTWQMRWRDDYDRYTQELISAAKKKD